MLTTNLRDSIRQAVSRIGPRIPFNARTFAEIGPKPPVSRILAGMAREGRIYRVARGIYVVTHLSRFGLQAMPTPQVVAEFVAAEEGTSLYIHGADAVRRFGFSTQMPTQQVYWTSGPSRMFKVGDLTFRWEHVAARTLVLGQRPAGEALAALWYLGKGHVSAQTFAVLRRKLKPDEFAALLSARKSMPGWMSAALDAFEGRQAGETHDLDW